MKNILIKLTIIFIITLFVSGVLHNKKACATVEISRVELGDFIVDEVNNDKVKCKFINDGSYYKNGIKIGDYIENCTLTIDEKTIFINGKDKRIEQKEDAIKNLIVNTKIWASFDRVQVIENNEPINRTALIIAYNLNDDFIYDSSYSLHELKLTLNGKTFDVDRYRLDAQDTFDVNGNNIDINKLDLNYENKVKNLNFIFGWKNSTNKLDKAFLLFYDYRKDNDYTPPETEDDNLSLNYCLLEGEVKYIIKDVNNYLDNKNEDYSNNSNQNQETKSNDYLFIIIIGGLVLSVVLTATLIVKR